MNIRSAHSIIYLLLTLLLLLDFVHIIYNDTTLQQIFSGSIKLQSISCYEHLGMNDVPDGANLFNLRPSIINSQVRCDMLIDDAVLSTKGANITKGDYLVFL